MRLRVVEAEVQDYRILKGPLKLAFSEGLNVIHAPNESGKSTFFEALWAGLALKARSEASAQQAMQPSGGGTPRVRVVFELDGARYTLEKRFGGNRSGETSLQIRAPDAPVVELHGDEAEDRVRQDLGVGAPTRDGTIKAQDQGTWSLLRVPQGGSVSAPHEDLYDDARSTLAGQLAAISGQVLAGEGADELFARARERYERYYTRRTGKESRAADSPLHQARQRQEAAADHVRELEARQAAHEQALASHALVSAQRDKLEALLPDVRQRLALAKQARDTLDELRAQRTELLHVAQLAEAEASRQAERDARREELRRDREAAAARVPPAEERLVQREADLEHLGAQGEALEQTRDAAELAARAWERRLRRMRAHGDALGAARERQRAEEELAEAERWAVGLESLRAALRPLRVSPRDLDHLETLDRDARLARERLQQAAARLDLRALGPLKLSEGGTLVNMDAGDLHEVEIIGRHTLRIGELVELTLTSGGEDLDARRRAAELGRRDLEDALSELGLQNLEQARAQRREAERLGLQLKAEQKARAGRPTPEALRQAVSDSRLREEEAKALRAQLSEPGDPELPESEAWLRPALREAEAEERALRHTAKAANDRLQHHQVQLVAARAEVKGARDALSRAQALAAERQADLTRHEETHGPDDQLREVHVTATLRARDAREALDALSAQLDALQPQRVERDLEGAKKSLRGAEDELQEKRGELRRLEGQLTAEQSVGLHDRLAQARAELDSAEAQVASELQEARAAELLFTTLERCRAEAQERYLAPLQEEVGRLLGQLFPGATASFDERYALTQLDRGALGAHSFDTLSQGAKEQLGVLVRLAIAKLLAGEHGALPVLLDDPFTNTDDERLQRMAQVLNEASQRLQIIVVTWDWYRLQRCGLFVENIVDLAAERRQQEA